MNGSGCLTPSTNSGPWDFTSDRFAAKSDALVHQDFAACIPVQISVYEDKLYISNDCQFPSGWTAETLMGKHRSCLSSPDIANTFFRAGYIESWGPGVEKIFRICRNYGIPEPEYTVHPNDIMLCFKANIGQQGGAQSSAQSGTQSIPGRILADLRQSPKRSLRSVALALGVSVKTVKQYVAKLQQAGSLRRIGGTRGHWEVIGG